MTSHDDINVIGLCGSLREKSYTRYALSIALIGAAQTGAQTELVDLKDFDLIFCDGKIADEDAPPDVLRLRHKLRGAHGFLIGTPIYHGSYSGVLKNAIDLMGFEEFSGKVIGLVSVAGGKMAGIHALDSLRSIGRALHAWVIPEQVAIPQVWKVFGDEGRLRDDSLRIRIEGVGQQVTRFAYLLHSEETRAFLEAWENAPNNPGGENV